MKIPVRSIALLLASASALLALPCLAGAPSLSPGLWQYTESVSGSGVALPDLSSMPSAMREKFAQAMTAIETQPGTINNKQCLTAADIAHMKWGPSSQKHCQGTTTLGADGAISVRMRCDMEQGAMLDMSGTGHILDSRHVQWDGAGTLQINGQTNHRRMHGEGKWISSTCGDVK